MKLLTHEIWAVVAGVFGFCAVVVIASVPLPSHSGPLAETNHAVIVQLTTDISVLNTGPVKFAGKVALKGGISCAINGSLAVVKPAFGYDDRVQVSTLAGTTMLCPGWSATRHVDGNFVPLSGAIGWQPPQTVVSVAPQYNGSTQYSRYGTGARLMANTGYRVPAGTLGTWSFFQTIEP